MLDPLNERRTGNHRQHSASELARKGWTRSEWFKLRVSTTDPNQEEAEYVSELPEEVSPYTAYGDYLNLDIFMPTWHAGRYKAGSAEMRSQIWAQTISGKIRV